MPTLVHRAMVWLGITDDEEELEMPIYRSEEMQRDRSSRSYIEEMSEEPAPPRVDKPASRVQVIANGDGFGEIRDSQSTQVLSSRHPGSPSILADGPGEGAMGQDRARTQVIRSIKPEGPKVHLAIPTKFRDVQEIADHMIGGRPVIVNIEGLDKEVYRRIIDFCSGLTYALGGKIRKVGEQVYLLTPSKVELADEEMERITERAVFRGN